MSVVRAGKFLGRWKLRPDLSRYQEGPLPREANQNIEPSGEALRFTAVWIEPSGEQRQIVHTIGFIERPPVFLTLVDERTLDSTVRRNGADVAHTRRRLSEDGDTMTVTQSSINEQGQPYTNVAVYARDAPQAS